MVMVPEERLQVRRDGYSALACVERRVGDGADDRVQCLLEYGSGDNGIWGDGKKLNCAFNYFPLVRFSLKLGLRISH